MTESILFNSLLLLVGLFLLFRNIHFFRNDNALRVYMENSPKAVSWVRKYGLLGAMKLVRETVIPLAFIASVAMVGFATWNLCRIHGWIG